MDKSIVLTRLHVLITHHIWLVFEKYAAPGAELITSLLDNLVKINNLYRLTICHNPVADIQKKKKLRKNSYTSYFCHSHSSLATILYANVSLLNKRPGGVNTPALVRGVCQWICINTALTCRLESYSVHTTQPQEVVERLHKEPFLLALSCFLLPTDACKCDNAIKHIARAIHARVLPYHCSVFQYLVLSISWIDDKPDIKSLTALVTAKTGWERVTRRIWNICLMVYSYFKRR